MSVKHHQRRKSTGDLPNTPWEPVPVLSRMHMKPYFEDPSDDTKLEPLKDSDSESSYYLQETPPSMLHKILFTGIDELVAEREEELEIAEAKESGEYVEDDDDEKKSAYDSYDDDDDYYDDDEYEREKRKREQHQIINTVFHLTSTYKFESQSSGSHRCYHVYEPITKRRGVLKISPLKSPYTYGQEPKEVQIHRQAQKLDGVVPMWDWHLIVETECYAIFMPFGHDVDLCNVFLEPPLVKKYMKQLLTVMMGFEKLNIFHRDIKPANIFWDVETEKLMVYDFDCACWDPHRVRQERVGTYGFESPEMTNKKRPGYTSKHDIYSAGVVFGMLLHHVNYEYDIDDEFVAEWRQKLAPKAPKFERKRRKKIPKKHKKTTVAKAKGEDAEIDEFFCRGDKHAKNLLLGMIEVNPVKRFTLEQCLNHPFFASTT